MRVLIIHNEYSQRGGEESVIEMQIRLFEQYGHTVFCYFRNHSEIKRMPYGKVRSFFISLGSRKAADDVRRLVRKERPDVAFIHNLFPLITPSVLGVLRREGVPSLYFAHNFRLLCPIGVFYNKKGVCESCASGLFRELNCVINRCEGTFPGSLSFALRNAVGRISGSIVGNLDKIISLTDFQRNKLCGYGIPKSKLTVIPNALDINGMPPAPVAAKGDYVAFVGRLSPEKGIELLLEAARRMPEVTFRVAGDASMLHTIGAVPPNLLLDGYKNREELALFYAQARLTVITSACYEGFPMVALEAMFYGTPVLAPDHGTFDSIFTVGEEGLTYGFNDPNSFCAQLRQALIMPDRLMAMGDRAAALVRERYNAARYYDRIMEIIDHIELELPKEKR